ncbi:YrbL family protein [Tepidamorphus sp. 3E244]|uniref:YrbL family protein n=1 Tax=Tepidamorphus sp. 3E244 TaxID=3385498 RepID=UPI0038FCA48E
MNDGKPAGTISLKDCTLVRKANMRNIYILPSRPGVVLKTIRPERVDGKGNLPEYGRIKNLRGFGAYHVFIREIEEYIRLRRITYGNRSARLPIPDIYELTDTEEGLGLVVEKMTDGNGKLAPTLAEIIVSKNLSPKHERALEAFGTKCKALHVVFGDVHLNNLVYTETRTGEPELVCIDGFGEKSLVPIHRWSKTVNARKIDRTIRRMQRLMVPGQLKLRTREKS